MKESQQYLQYFKHNLALIVIFIIFTTAMSLFFLSKQPVLFEESILYEIKSSTELTPQNTIKADEAVGVLRNSSFQKKINLSQDAKLTVYKPGPLSINVTIKSPDSSLNSKNHLKVAEYLVANYQFTQIGEKDIKVIKPNFAQGLFAGIFAGAFLGVIASLIKTYFVKY